VRDGLGPSVRSCGTGKARERERSSVQAPLPHCGAPAGLFDGGKRRRGELLKRGGDGGGRERLR
jgi:hypothetical protein